MDRQQGALRRDRTTGEDDARGDPQLIVRRGDDPGVLSAKRQGKVFQRCALGDLTKALPGDDVECVGAMGGGPLDDVVARGADAFRGSIFTLEVRPCPGREARHH
jgi:hypothetical protein